MLRRVLIAAAGVVAIIVSAAQVSQAAEFGTAEEAKAMLEKVVVAVNSDKAKALEAFNAGADGFKDRDLYPFCANAADGVITAHPVLKGKQLRDIKDKNGFALGEEMMKVADTEGKIGEVAYMWPRPGSDTPSQKVSYVTKISDQICGVGYYQ